ncbi:hypothetical protein FISHEDRAFT_55227 [Fistulina hepatica ATCC 64428]|uniref:Uncharacterized protein n=1 Tax=Fistulina hepatica ATCC 64428 TaxID=1128425 RepID=A0A0D7ANN5_9AGAR|nr:hypothetical protein FISHEDRAFT_55227 [Fistulina hepatica ATCC 64428]
MSSLAFFLAPTGIPLLRADPLSPRVSRPSIGLICHLCEGRTSSMVVRARRSHAIIPLVHSWAFNDLAFFELPLPASSLRAYHSSRLSSGLFRADAQSLTSSQRAQTKGLHFGATWLVHESS